MPGPRRSPIAASRGPQALLPRRLPRRDRLEGHRLPCSQIHGLDANVLVPRLERAPRNDVHPDTQELFQILKQADVIKKRSTRLEVHEQIQVAVRASLTPGDGAGHGYPTSPALPRDAKDLRAATAEPLQGQHVIAHTSSVSPRAPTPAWGEE